MALTIVYLEQLCISFVICFGWNRRFDFDEIIETILNYIKYDFGWNFITKYHSLLFSVNWCYWLMHHSSIVYGIFPKQCLKKKTPWLWYESAKPNLVIQFYGSLQDIILLYGIDHFLHYIIREYTCLGRLWHILMGQSDNMNVTVCEYFDVTGPFIDNQQHH